MSVGNPHLVVLTDGSGRDDFSEERLAVLGPFFAAHPGIPGGTNVQLARSVDGRIEALHLGTGGRTHIGVWHEFMRRGRSTRARRSDTAG